MNMRKIYLSLFAAVLIAGASFSSARAADVYKMDPVHSAALFKVGHLGIGFVRGAFTDIDGKVVYDRKNISKSSVEIIIKTTSVNTFNDKRDEHLRTADFFDVEKYPEMSFKSVKVKKLNKNTVLVTGDFSLLGVTKRITVKAIMTGEGKDPWGGMRAAFETSFSIKRSTYGMNKMIPAAGDRVDISLNFEGVKQ